MNSVAKFSWLDIKNLSSSVFASLNLDRPTPALGNHDFVKLFSNPEFSSKETQGACLLMMWLADDGKWCMGVALRPRGRCKSARNGFEKNRRDTNVRNVRYYYRSSGWLHTSPSSCCIEIARMDRNPFKWRCGGWLPWERPKSSQKRGAKRNWERRKKKKCVAQRAQSGMSNWISRLLNAKRFILFIGRSSPSHSWW